MVDPASLQATLRGPLPSRQSQSAAVAKAGAAHGRTSNGPEAVERAGSAPVNYERMAKEVAEVREQLQRHGLDISMEPQKGLDPAIVKVRNRETGDLIRQIPSKEWVQMRRNLAEGLGLIFDERV